MLILTETRNFFEIFKCYKIDLIHMEKISEKKNHYDHETLERMKKYYKVEDHDDLLRFIKTHGLKEYNFQIDDS